MLVLVVVVVVVMAVGRSESLMAFIVFTCMRLCNKMTDFKGGTKIEIDSRLWDMKQGKGGRKETVLVLINSRNKEALNPGCCSSRPVI